MKNALVETLIEMPGLHRFYWTEGYANYFGVSVKAGCYVPFNSQGHTERAPQHCHLFGSDLDSS